MGLFGISPSLRMGYDGLLEPFVGPSTVELLQSFCEATDDKPFIDEENFLPSLDKDQYSINNGILSDQQHFWEILIRAIPRTSFTPPSGRTTRILDVGCGDAWDAEPLVAYFETEANACWEEGTVTYLGVDVEASAIESARSYHENQPGLQFAQGDGTDFTTFLGPEESQEEKFDVIVIRHPGPLRADESVETWKKIFDESYAHLSETGILLVTNYHLHEYCFTKHFFKWELGAVEYLSGSNPFGEEWGRWRRDHFISIFGAP